MAAISWVVIVLFAVILMLIVYYLSDAGYVLRTADDYLDKYPDISGQYDSISSFINHDLGKYEQYLYDSCNNTLFDLDMKRKSILGLFPGKDIKLNFLPIECEKRI
jgi:hypothetical protein